jgi:hypothetical protein
MVRVVIEKSRQIGGYMVEVNRVDELGGDVSTHDVALALMAAIRMVAVQEGYDFSDALADACERLRKPKEHPNGNS